MTDSPFSLDLVENPHPNLIDRAVGYRRVAMMTDNLLLRVRWLSYLEAMADATGYSPADVDAWVAEKAGDPIEIAPRDLDVTIPAVAIAFG